MTNSTACTVPKRPSLNYHLIQADADPALRHLIVDIARACKYISYALQTTESGLAGSVNQFGEEQAKMDVVSDEIIQQALCESTTVHSYVSEEQEDVVELDPDGKYTVMFDPLDGSSLIDANFAIGSIFAIYEGGDVIGRKINEQKAALYVLYGPRTVLVYTIGDATHSFILNDVGEFILLEQHMGIADDAKNYSPGNLRAVNENEEYKAAMQRWLDEAMTLRYSGCMVADIHHILAKGQGVFSNVGGEKYPDGKLRLAIEVGPFAFLVEQAGGSATDGSQPIMEKTLDTIEQRTPIIIGSTNEVKKVEEILKD